MICVSKQQWNRQWKLFIDYSQIDILCYGDAKVIEDYFNRKKILFSVDESDLGSAGWDYLLCEDDLYFIIDTERKVEDLVTPIFIWYDEVRTIRDLTTFLKEWIRNDKIKKLSNDFNI